MRVDSNYRMVEVQNHPFLKEDVFCFCRIDTTNRDVYDIEPRLNVDKDRISVYWTEEQLKTFQPNKGSHEVRRLATAEHIDELIKTLKLKVRSTKKDVAYFRNSGNTKMANAWYNYQQNLESRISELGRSIILLVKVKVIN